MMFIKWLIEIPKDNNAALIDGIVIDFYIRLNINNIKRLCKTIPCKMIILS